MDTTQTIAVAEDDAEVRLDRWVKQRFQDSPRRILRRPTCEEGTATKAIVNRRRIPPRDGFPV